MVVKNTYPTYKKESERQAKLREAYVIVYRKVNNITHGVIVEKK